MSDIDFRIDFTPAIIAALALALLLGLVGWRLRGRKIWLSNALLATGLLLFCLAGTLWFLD